jgi:hypothetical protein
VVDRARDAALRTHLEFARRLRGLPERERATALSNYIDDVMSRAADGKRLDRHEILPSQIAWENGRAGQEVLLGDVGNLGAGVCRHRSMLFKVMGDEAGLNVALVRGNAGEVGNLGGHAWNEVVFNEGDRVIMDVMNPKPNHQPLSLSKAQWYFGMDNRPMYPGG